jgi:hypothetical protein
MAEKTLDRVKESIKRDFEKQFPQEKLYGKVFSIYLLDKYSSLLLKIYQKTKQEQNGITGK